MGRGVPGRKRYTTTCKVLKWEGSHPTRLFPLSHLHLRTLIARHVLRADGRLDELVRDGRRRRQPQVALLVVRPGRLAQRARPDPQRLLDLGDLEPPRVLQLRVVLQADRLVRGVADLRDGPDHQVRRVRPRLRRVDDHPRQDHPGLLPNLAADGVLDGFRGLDEPRQRRVPVRREALLSAQEDAFAVAGEDGYDDGRVCTGEGEVGDGRACAAGRALGGLALLEQGGVPGRTGALGACVHRQSGVAAGAAEGVARVPVHEGAGLGVDGGYRNVVSNPGICLKHDTYKYLHPPATSSPSSSAKT